MHQFGNALLGAVAYDGFKEFDVAHCEVVVIRHSYPHKAPEQLCEAERICKIVFVTSVYRVVIR